MFKILILIFKYCLVTEVLVPPPLNIDPEASAFTPILANIHFKIKDNWQAHNQSRDGVATWTWLCSLLIHKSQDFFRRAVNQKTNK